MAATNMTTSEKGSTRPQTLKELKCRAIEQALAATDGRKIEAARLLDVSKHPPPKVGAFKIVIRSKRFVQKII